MDLECIMKLIVMVILLYARRVNAAVKTQAYFNETGELPCQFKNPQNRSLNEMILFLQDQKNQVLFELYNGIEKTSNVHDSYKGRTSFDQNTWTLQLHNVQIKDRGTYYCFIHHKRSTGLMLIHQMISELSVIANYSQPEIKPLSNITENPDIINLTCSSIHGYPDPVDMWFLIKTENSTNVPETSMVKSQNNITGLYDVSISLSFPVPHGASSINISCILQPEPTVAQLHSPPLIIDIELPETVLPDAENILWKVAVPAILVTMCVMVLFLRKRKKKQSGLSETIQVDGGERENNGSQKDVQIPDIPTEAQHIINILKIAESHKNATHS
ncbi:T-lymphocyte activation antigen CD86 isoform X3 [Erinaceus europaeus]|uniref:T-lymphocyte activation antigen CD86 isoform X3 n=2 Tax=Erinaceus europaeus TaxID=9365 RepID=A0ABM3XZM7_ERIEU|nr:T-lymphocyte activation antigen CD86 isoform X3 [Erinaceus europaeus]